MSCRKIVENFDGHFLPFRFFKNHLRVISINICYILLKLGVFVACYVCQETNQSLIDYINIFQVTIICFAKNGPIFWLFFCVRSFSLYINIFKIIKKSWFASQNQYISPCTPSFSIVSVSGLLGERYVNHLFQGGGCLPP